MIARLALIALLASPGCALTPAPESESPEREAVAAALDDFHAAAVEAHEERYFGLLAPEAVFLGTDPKERWTKEAFRAWAAPYFQRESAWVFTPEDRYIFLAGDRSTAWFDEKAVSEHYGECRGTGVLRKVKGAWKISQYNLTLPVPNDLMKEVVRMIEEYSDVQPP